MTIDILSLSKLFFSRSAINKLSEFLAEDILDVQKALDGTLPLILGGIMQKASLTPGAHEILAQVKHHSDSFISGDLVSLLEDFQRSQDFRSNGELIISKLFGSQGKIEDAIERHSGIKKSSASFLIILSALLIFSITARHVKTNSIGLAGLVSLLMSQKETVMMALPTQLSTEFNFKDLGEFKGAESMRIVQQETKIEILALAWLPWIIGVFLMLAVLFTSKTCSGKGQTIWVVYPNGLQF